MDKVDNILTRGVANIIPGKEELEKLLSSGKKLNVYLGIDATATHIHLGHAVILRKLQSFAELGHNVTFLIGDFTALVGDTSDKDSERPILTPEEIEKNFQTYKEQASKIIDFSKVKVVHNSDWLKKLTYEEILKLKKHFSLNDFISRELIKKRLSEGKNVGLLETEYPIMQGYDSYFMDTDLQIGGADQTFNMQAGRTLQKNLRDKESFVLTTQYLVGTDGRKMSKSWGNAIWLDDSASDMFAKVMKIEDNLIIDYFTLATEILLEDIEQIKKELEKENPINVKKKLAFEIVKELNGESEAKEAGESFEKTVQQKEIPSDILEITVSDNITVSEVLVNSNLSESKSEAKRLIEQGGVSIDDKKIIDPDSKIEEGILKVGKRNFRKVIIK